MPTSTRTPPNNSIYRGTQRICSSHYLFPRGISLAGKNTGVSISWLGNFVIDRGFAWELLTFFSISTRAGCRNSEDWGRLKKKKKKKKKKKNPFPLPESSHKHTTAGQSDCAFGKNLFCPGFVAFVRSFWIEGFESARNSWLGNQPILSSWLGNFSCVLLGKKNR